MFELEDYSSVYHDGFLNKYVDSNGPNLDYYISDSLQEMLDVDIRSEIANVVGGNNELASLVNDLPSSLDHAIEALSAINNTSSNISSNIYSNNNTNTSSSSSSTLYSSSSWFGGSHTGPSWSNSNDFYVDVGACVNPISVMPLISSSLMHNSPKANLNRQASPPLSPTHEAKSHLTFSPAQVKVAPGSIRHEQIMSHIPKQIVAISSSVTAATTAPATLATNSALQRKNNAVDAIRKDLGSELRKSNNCNVTLTTTPSITSAISTTPITTVNVIGNVGIEEQSKSLINGNSVSNGSNVGGNTNTIKLAPGIGGLTFANSITYNKLKQQSVAKSPQGSPVTSNGTIVLKRDRDSSPLHNMTTLNGVNGNLTKILSRNVMQTVSGYTPKSIASSAHSPHIQNGSIGSPSSNSSSSISSPSTHMNNYNGASNITTINRSFTSSPAHNNNIIAVKPLQQKIKAAPVESEFPKPAYSYSCLIALALKNSRSGSLPVSEIYSFMCEHFPYFKTAPSGWKNSVRHNLSLNKCFEKIEKPATNGSQRKGCLWAMNPERIVKMDEEVQKWSRKDPLAIRNAMVFPEHLDALERGEMKHGSSGDSDVELDSQSEIEEASDLEEPELDDAIVDNMFVEEDVEEEDDDDDELLDETMLNNSNIVVVNDMIGERNNDIGSLITHQNQLQQNNQRHQRVHHHIQQHHQVTTNNQQRDFDIEVDDFYDAIELEDEKCLNANDIIELSPSDLNTKQHNNNNNGYQSPKRARLNINYTIANDLEKQLQHQNIKQIKVQQQHQQIQQHTNQHILVQKIQTANLNNNMNGTTNGHFQPISTLSTNPHRRKMQLVNRIA